MTAREAVQNGDRTRKTVKDIGLWGSPGCGKSSFISALSIAVAQSRSDWTLVGMDDESVEYLARSTSILTGERRFPAATEVLEELGWILLKETEVRSRSGLFRREQVSTLLSELHLELLDAPGGMFGEDGHDTGGRPPAPSGDDLFDEEGPTDLAVVDGGMVTDQRKLVERLAGADGIVYLFDPIRELKYGDAFKYFQRTLAQIALLARDSGRMRGARLPHHLAVCVTKFDDPRVYELARRKRYASLDGEGDRIFPRVAPEYAEDLFATLCEVASGGNASLVRDTIGRFFAPERVRYFASSSVGFYLHRGRWFRPHDYQNVILQENGQARIRGPIHPINVVEPLLWLGEQLSGVAAG